MDLPQGGPHHNTASPSVHWTGQFPSLLGASCGPSVSTRQTQQCSALSLLYSLVTDRIRDLHELTNRFCLDHNIYLSGGCCLHVNMSHFTSDFFFKSRNAGTQWVHDATCSTGLSECLRPSRGSKGSGTPLKHTD